MAAGLSGRKLSQPGDLPSTKGSAKRSLIQEFEEGSDYLLNNIVKQHDSGTKYSEQILLTVDCFKAFCMMAKTQRGKEVRRFYIDIEKRYRNIAQAIRNTPAIE